MHVDHNWAPSSEVVSSSIPSWQILTAHAKPFRGARDLAFCLKVPLDSLLVWASSGGSGETARMRRLALTFAARIGDKYQIRLTRSSWSMQDQMQVRVQFIQYFSNQSSLPWGLGAVAWSEVCPLGIKVAPSLIPMSGILFRRDLVLKKISMAILPLPLIQKEQLSVTG